MDSIRSGTKSGLLDKLLVDTDNEEVVSWDSSTWDSSDLLLWASKCLVSESVWGL